MANIIIIANCEVDGEVRLAGGSGPNEGRVEFCYRRLFGTVCGSQWDTIDAQVICRQFGYPIEGEIFIQLSAALVSTISKTVMRSINSHLALSESLYLTDPCMFSSYILIVVHSWLDGIP